MTSTHLVRPAKAISYPKPWTLPGFERDVSLIDRFAQGDESAFTELFNRYKFRIWKLIYQMTGDVERSEDLLQETFIRVYRHLHRFDRSKKFMTWIYTIASNLARNEYRNRTRDPLILFQSLMGDSAEDSDQREIQFEDPRARPDNFPSDHPEQLKRLITKVLKKLPKEQRRAFKLREFKGKSYEEIAIITGCNLGTVKSRLSRARTAFEEFIKPLVALEDGEWVTR